MHFHPSVCRWWCGRLFFSSLHTTILHMCVHFIDHLTHHHSSQTSFHCVGGGVGNLSSSSSSHTPPSAHIIPYHSLSFITTFIPMSCVLSSAQSYKHQVVGVRLYWFMGSLDFESAQSLRPVFHWGQAWVNQKALLAIPHNRQMLNLLPYSVCY